MEGGSVLVSPLAATEEPTLAVAGLVPAVWWDTLTSCLWRAAGVWSGPSECHSQNTRAPEVGLRERQVQLEHKSQLP